MSVDFSKYPATRVSTLLKNVGVRDGVAMYGYLGGFGVGLDKNIGLSWTEHKLIANKFFPQTSDIVHNYVGYPTFGLNVKDKLQTRAYNVFINDTSAYNTVIGYNSSYGAYPSNYDGNGTINRTTLNLYSDYEPRRCFVRAPSPETYLPKLTSANPLAPLRITFNTLFDTSDYDVSNAEQWFMSHYINGWLSGIPTAYINSARFNPDNLVPAEIDFSSANVFSAYLDNNFIDAILFTGGSGNAAPYEVTYKRADGSITVSDLQSKYSRYVNSNNWIGGIMPDFPEINIKELFDEHYPEITDDNHSGQKCVYLKNKWYGIHEVDGVNRLTDVDGNVYSGSMDEIGACVQQMTSDVTVESIYWIYPVAHMSLAATALCSVGIPVRTWHSVAPTSFFDSNGDISSFYQSRISATGECTGEFFPLANNREQFQAITDASNIVFRDTEKIPINETPLKIPDKFLMPFGLRTYALTQPQFSALMQKLYELPDNIIDLISKYNTNISDSIRNINIYPFNIANNANVTGTTLSYFGETLVPDVYEIRQTNSIIDMGSFTINQENDFRIYEPYTQYYIYLPYVGIRKIDSRDCVGHTINIKYVVDYITGECRCNIFRDGVMITSYTGVCGINIPIISRDYNSIMGNVNRVVSSSVSMARVNTPDDIPQTALTALTTTNIFKSSVSENGETGTTTAFSLPQYPFIFRISAKSHIPENYGHVTGYVCDDALKIADCDGFTVCQNVDVSGIPATETEKQQIKNFLESGFFA